MNKQSIRPFENKDFEILISTMDRNSLDFLIPMFPFSHFSHFLILIINQTKENNLLVSEFENIRVINSFEKGLSISRNLALENAIGNVILITDDDVIFKEGFDKNIIQSHEQHNKAVISFCTEKPDGLLFKKYLSYPKMNLSLIELSTIMSIEITINRLILEKANIKFDEYFGLGSNFKMGEEAVFLSDFKKQNQQIGFMPKVISIHSEISSNEKFDFLERYYIQGALLTRVINPYYFLGLMIKFFFDLKQKKLKFSQILDALESAKRGKNDYNKLIQRNNA